MWLSVRSEVQIVCIWSSCCHCHPKTPSSLASFKSIWPLWYWRSKVVLEKRPLNGWSVAVLVFQICSLNTQISVTSPHGCCVQDVLSSDRRRHALTLRVRDYYASERLYLLRCLKHLLSFYSEQHHPYSVSTAVQQSIVFVTKSNKLLK